MRRIRTRSAEDANARITITIKSSARGARRDARINQNRALESESCVYGRAFDSLGRQIQMTSEVHVTISGAQRGGMHPCAHLARSRFLPPSHTHREMRCFSRAEENGEQDSQSGRKREKETEEEIFIAQFGTKFSLRAAGYYHTERD